MGAGVNLGVKVTLRKPKTALQVHADLKSNRKSLTWHGGHALD